MESKRNHVLVDQPVHMIHQQIKVTYRGRSWILQFRLGVCGGGGGGVIININIIV